jgi:hypothetical protein
MTRTGRVDSRSLALFIGCALYTDRVAQAAGAAADHGVIIFRASLRP